MLIRPSQIALFVSAAAVFLFGFAASSHAQAIGTFTWQFQPFCNVVHLNVTQQGSIFTLDGFDDQCGGAKRAAVVGTAVPNPDGTVGLGFTIAPPAGGAVSVTASVNLATFNGSWQDSAGHAGTFAFGQQTGGTARPTLVGSGAVYEFPATNFATSNFATLTIPVGVEVANRSSWSVQMYYAPLTRSYLVPGPGYGGTTTYRVSVQPAATNTTIYIDKAGTGETYTIRVIRTTP